MGSGGGAVWGRRFRAFSIIVLVIDLSPAVIVSRLLIVLLVSIEALIALINDSFSFFERFPDSKILGADSEKNFSNIPCFVSRFSTRISFSVFGKKKSEDVSLT